MSERLRKMRIGQLNKIYVAAHFLKVEGIKMAIAGYLACLVYIGDKEDENAKGLTG